MGRRRLLDGTVQNRTIAFAIFPVRWRFLFESVSPPYDGIVAGIPVRAPIVPGTVAFSILHRVHDGIRCVTRV